jgi:hypothetical protein
MEPFVGAVVHGLNSINRRLVAWLSGAVLANDSIECPPRDDGAFARNALRGETSEAD